MLVANVGAINVLSRSGKTDWNAGIPPASVCDRTEQVGTERQDVSANVRWVTDRRAVTSATADNGGGLRVDKRKVGNRLPGGYVGASRQLDRQNTSAKPKRPMF
jgi:hypothetical protein